MHIKEEFISASVNPRSHCLTACRSRNLVVYASELQLAVQTIPNGVDECGVIQSLSERRHIKPITTVKRIKSEDSEDFFVTGGVDSRIVLWKFNPANEKIEFLNSLEGCSGSIGAVCGAHLNGKFVVFAAWVSETSSGLEVWHVDNENISKSSIFLDQKAFALCLDSTIYNDSILLAIGTSKRFVEIFGESSDQTFTRLTSFAGHTDWIHSITFNDNSSKLLLASAGQDTYVRLWLIEEDGGRNEEAEDELTSAKSKFEMTLNAKICMKMSSYAVMQGHDDWVHSTSWNKDGNVLLTASSDKTCIIWREIDDLWRDDVRLGIIGGQAAGFFAGVFSQNEKFVVSSSYFGGIHAWCSENDEATYWAAVPMSGGHVGEVRDVSWQRGANGMPNFLVSVGKDQTTRVFANYEKQGVMVEIARPQVHGHDMQCLTMVNPSVFVSGAEEKIFRAFRAPKSFVCSLESISRINAQNIFGDAKIAEFGACVPALGLSNKAMAEGETVDGEHWEEDAFRAKPNILTVPPTEDALQQNTLWPEEHKLYGHGYEVYAVTVNPTGNVLATACKSSHAEHSVVILWSTSDWSKKAEIPGHQLTVTQIAWNQSGTVLLSVSRDRTAKLYREASGNVDGYEYSCFWTSQKQHTRIIWACDWFDDDNVFATASRDQKVIVWKINQNECSPLAQLKLAEPVTAIAVSPGTVVAVGLQSGEVVFLKLNGEELTITASLFENQIPQIDASILRLRFASSVSEHRLAIATSDSKLRILSVTD
ncbi:unnamed protein product [Caenorhabditis bovis]|uniref:Elongator complex protein 2 n=1 Tax=Caenorhabditis bovis TaxID=2654633 RepID=A0A8S1EY70_9PELO|nr:unnamed protein product [Caenorhabditis bovis]